MSFVPVNTSKKIPASFLLKIGRHLVSPVRLRDIESVVLSLIDLKYLQHPHPEKEESNEISSTVSQTV